VVWCCVVWCGVVWCGNPNANPDPTVALALTLL
jgi:hypothetical protein